MTEDTPMITPRHTMLMVMDYEPTIIDRLPGGPELVPRMAETIAMAREAGLSVGYIRVAFTDEDYEAIPAWNTGLRGAVVPERKMHDDAPETQVHEALAPHEGDLVIRKTRVGAFATTDIDKQLRERGIEALVLAGLTTSGVVLSTVREASDRDYQLFVLEDLTADRDAQVHEVLMEKVFPRQSTVITSAELAELVRVS